MRTSSCLLRAAALLAAGAVAASAQTTIRKREFKHVPPGDGEEMYDAYCASCHGADLRGTGPAAAALKVKPPDLTVLAAQNNGEFPTLRVMSALDNLGTGASHGSSEMPLWGSLFRASGDSSAVVHTRIYNLVRFLQATQMPSARTPDAPPPARKQQPQQVRVRDVDPTDGAAMYKAYCASCHGADGRGFGPAAGAIAKQLPDLSVLTRTHDGKFPNAHVTEVLGLRAGNVTAHGSKEMPIWGNVFRDTREDSAQTHLRIANLVAYLKSIQQ